MKMTFVLVGLLFAGGLWAETEELRFGLEGPRLFGADFKLTQGAWKLGFGAGYQSLDVGRDNLSGEPLPVSNPKTSSFLLNETVRLQHTWVFEEASLWLGAGVLAHGNLGTSATPAFVLDRDGGTLGFIQAGLLRDRRTTNSHRLTSGSKVDLMVEAGPRVLSVRGTDYQKVSLSTSAYVPLWDLPGPTQTSWGMMALRANAQWIDGLSVPLLAFEPTEVRGYERLLDTRFRSVASAEFRTGLPSFASAEVDWVPVLLAFAEGGWYAGYANAPSSSSHQTGWLASVGAGFGTTILGITTPTFTVAFPLIEESGLWWDFSFNIAF